MRESHTGRALAPVLKAGPYEAREVYDPQRQARVEAELRKAPKLDSEAHMPWQIDGVKWHTEGQRALSGGKEQWDPAFLLWFIEQTEKGGDFAPSDWNDQSRVEVTARGKADTWFCHVRTRSKECLDISLRVPKGTYAESKLAARLAIPTLDERKDLPIYGQWSRVRLRSSRHGWDEIRLHPCDFKDVDKRVWTAFLKEAAAAYLAKVGEQKSGREGKPWETDGRKWHMSQGGVSANQPIQWTPTTLASLVGRLSALERGLAANWNTKGAVLIGVADDAPSKGAGKGKRGKADSSTGAPRVEASTAAPPIRIVTYSANGLRVEIRAPRNVLTPVHIDRLGRSPRIKRGTDGDVVQFWIQKIKDNDPQQLKDVWRLCRGG